MLSSAVGRFTKPSFPIPGLTCETFYTTAKYIGGDHYHFLPLQADRWGIAIGDVCGKASLQTALH
jgi:serine phosphatase RsbU (regulator of sigma subunit)